MYSKKLQQEKLINSHSETVGLEMGEDYIIELLDNFCTRDDIIGVPTPKVFELFNEYCRELGKPKINRVALGKTIKKHFRVERIVLSVGCKTTGIYVPVEEEGCLYHDDN